MEQRRRRDSTHLFNRNRTTIIIVITIALLILTSCLEGYSQQPKAHAPSADNAFYWRFVVTAWPPIFAVIYLAPR
jgi:heme/copper-type cytochrome/quinol oxidase subunit 3